MSVQGGVFSLGVVVDHAVGAVAAAPAAVIVPDGADGAALSRVDRRSINSRARDVDHYIQLRQAGVEAPERETFEAALKSGRMTLEALGLGAYEARERADLFRRFNLQMVEEMVAMAENDAASRVAVFKRTSDMLTGIINEDRHHLSLVQRHGWQGTEEGRHTGDIADEPENKPSA